MTKIQVAKLSFRCCLAAQLPPLLSTFLPSSGKRLVDVDIFVHAVLPWTSCANNIANEEIIHCAALVVQNVPVQVRSTEYIFVQQCTSNIEHLKAPDGRSLLPRGRGRALVEPQWYFPSSAFFVYKHVNNQKSKYTASITKNLFATQRPSAQPPVVIMYVYERPMAGLLDLAMSASLANHEPC